MWKDYKTPRDVTVGKKETVAFDSSNVEKNESLKGTRKLKYHHVWKRNKLVQRMFDTAIIRNPLVIYYSRYWIYSHLIINITEILE